MSIWKQLALSAIVLVIAAAAWVKFFPGAPEILASLGNRLGAASADKAADKTGATDTTARRPARSQRHAADRDHADVTLATINGRLSAIGTGRANNSVVVTPYSSGTLTEIAVTPGSRSKPAASLRGSIPIPKRLPSTAPRSRSATPNPSATG